jgi:hypothetical protein
MFFKNVIYMYTYVTIVWLVMNSDTRHEKMIYEFTRFTFSAHIHTSDTYVLVAYISYKCITKKQVSEHNFEIVRLYELSILHIYMIQGDHLRASRESFGRSSGRDTRMRTGQWFVKPGSVCPKLTRGMSVSLPPERTNNFGEDLYWTHCTIDERVTFVLTL